MSIISLCFCQSICQGETLVTAASVQSVFWLAVTGLNVFFVLSTVLPLWLLHTEYLLSPPPLQLNDIGLHHTLLGVLLHQLNTQCALAELHHGLPEWWIQEDLAHDMALQSGSVTLQVAQELLAGQVQVFTKHVNVQVIPK